MVAGGPTQLQIERACSGTHHRPAVGAAELLRLLAPAGQGQVAAPGQGITEGTQAGAGIVQQVIQSGGRPAKMQKAPVAIAPHGVQGVGQSIQYSATASQQGKPEQRSVNTVIAVFQHGLDGGAGAAGRVQLRAVAADHHAGVMARLFQVVGTECVAHTFGVLAQAPAADTQVQHTAVNDHGSQRSRHGLRQHSNQKRGGYYRNAPGQSPLQLLPCRPVVRRTLLPAGLVQAGLQPMGHAPEAHQGVKAFRLPQPLV